MYCQLHLIQQDSASMAKQLICLGHVYCPLHQIQQDSASIAKQLICLCHLYCPLNQIIQDSASIANQLICLGHVYCPLHQIQQDGGGSSSTDPFHQYQLPPSPEIIACQERTAITLKMNNFPARFAYRCMSMFCL